MVNLSVDIRQFRFSRFRFVALLSTRNTLLNTSACFASPCHRAQPDTPSIILFVEKLLLLCYYYPCWHVPHSWLPLLYPVYHLQLIHHDRISNKSPIRIFLLMNCFNTMIRLGGAGRRGGNNRLSYAFSKPKVSSLVVSQPRATSSPSITHLLNNTSNPRNLSELTATS